MPRASTAPASRPWRSAPNEPLAATNVPTPRITSTPPATMRTTVRRPLPETAAETAAARSDGVRIDRLAIWPMRSAPREGSRRHTMAMPVATSTPGQRRRSGSHGLILRARSATPRTMAPDATPRTRSTSRSTPAPPRPTNGAGWSSTGSSIQAAPYAITPMPLANVSTRKTTRTMFGSMPSCSPIPLATPAMTRPSERRRNR